MKIPIVVSILFTLFLALSAKSTVQLSILLFSIVAANYIALYAGALIGNAIKIKRANIQLSGSKRETRLAKLILWIGVIAFCARIIDKFLIREAIFSLDLNSTLAHLQEQGSTALGFITAPLLFFCLYPYVYSKYKNIAINFSGIAFFFPALDSLLTGQRFVLLFSAFVFVFVNIAFSGKKIAKNKIFSLVAFVALVASIGLYVINLRYTSRGQDVFYSLENSAYAEFLVVSSIAKNSDNLIIGLLLNILFYFQHAIFEFQNALATSSQPITYGAFNFPIIFKVMAGFGYEFDAWSQFEKEGIYLSYFGASWFDFNIAAFFLTFTIGLALSFAYKNYSRRNDTTSLLIYIYICYTVIFFPVTTMIGYGQGNYIICALIMIKLINSQWRI